MPSPANDQTSQADGGGPQGNAGDSALPRVVRPQTSLGMPMADAMDAATGEIPLTDSGNGVLPSAGWKGLGSVEDTPEPYQPEPFITRERFRNNN